jgi:outer membrane protein assembly factor BamB
MITAMTPHTIRLRLFPVAVAWLAAGLLLVGSTSPRADAPANAPGTPRDWPGLRGEAAAGQGGSRRFPSSWAAGDWAWAVDLPGTGHASPVVWQGQVYTASALVDPADATQCVRTLSCHEAATGKLLWHKKFPGPVEAFNAQNSLASSTPVADAAGVIWLWGTRDNLRAEAFSHAGEQRWHADLGPFNTEHGFAGSPALWRDLLVVPMEQDGPSRIVALDTATGKTRWTLEREKARTAYSPPLVLEGKEGSPRPPQIVLGSMAHGLTGIDPATGRVLWERKCLPKRSVSCPVVVAQSPGDDGERVIVGTCGDGGGDNTLVAVRAPAVGNAGGETIEPEVAYQLDRSAAPYVPSPLAVGEKLYLWGDRGVVTCVNAATGEVAYRGRVGGTFSGSPVAVGGAILNVSADGEVIVIADGREFEILGRTALGEEVRSSPAVADGRLFIRSAGRLFCLSALPE